LLGVTAIDFIAITISWGRSNPVIRTPRQRSAAWIDAAYISFEPGGGMTLVRRRSSPND
jgi:hypothetical protein